MNTSCKFKIALICAFLFLLSFGLFFQTNNYKFIDLDDGPYVYTNSMVMKGLNLETLSYAFSMKHVKDTTCYHPITTITYLLNVSLFGVDSGAMHLFNAAIHSINGIWLFLFLLLLLKKKVPNDVELPESICESKQKLCGTPILVAVIGALFWVLHPLRVEVVAWVASRKDVMCMFFMLPGLIAHLYGKRMKSEKYIVISTICFLLALLSKPTSLVYPLLAMILEFIETRNIVWKKNLGFVYIMIIMMGWTFVVQNIGGGMEDEPPTLLTRIGISFLGIEQYVRTTVFPHNLYPLYKYEIPLPLPRVILGIILTLLCFSLFARKFSLLKKLFLNSDKDTDTLYTQNYYTLLVFGGIVWFFVALAPVLGVVKFGMAPYADRFTYLPSIGFSIIISSLLLQLSRKHTPILLYSAMVVCLFITCTSIKTYHQTKRWKDELTLFTYATQIDDENYFAHTHLGLYNLHNNNLPQSLSSLINAAQSVFFLKNNGIIAYADLSNITKAMAVVFSALEGEPLEVERSNATIRHHVQHSRIYKANVSDDDPLAVQKLLAQGLYAYKDELFPQAKEYFGRALKLSPSDRMAWAIYGDVLERLGDKTGAIDAYNESLKLKYDHRLAKKLKQKPKKCRFM